MTTWYTLSVNGHRETALLNPEQVAQWAARGHDPQPAPEPAHLTESIAGILAGLVKVERRDEMNPVNKPYDQLTLQERLARNNLIMHGSAEFEGFGDDPEPTKRKVGEAPTSPTQVTDCIPQNPSPAL